MNLTETLYQLTARVMPSKFKSGVPYNILAHEIANKQNVTKKQPRQVYLYFQN